MHLDDDPALDPLGAPAPGDEDVVEVLVRRLDGAPLPARARPGDAGLDLVTTEDVVLGPGQRRTVGTGIAVALPAGTAAFVLPRSGLAARHGVTVLNAPGTVDAGYRGEIRVTLLNTDATTEVRFGAGDRIAQLVVLTIPGVRLVEVDRLPGSARGEEGFGSTGLSRLVEATGQVPDPAGSARADVTAPAQQAPGTGLGGQT